MFGTFGACRKGELVNIKIHDIEQYYTDTDREHKNPMILIRIPFTKNGEARSFTIKEPCYSIYKKYAALRPQNVGHDRFFVNFQNGKCTKQPIGINKFGCMPKMIATFLDLPNPETFTGHCFRHTSATLFVEGGGNKDGLKRHGGWKSDSSAEGYVAKSKIQKERAYDTISSAMNLAGPSCRIDSTHTLTTLDLNVAEKENKSPTDTVLPDSAYTLRISDCTNCTFNIIEKKSL